MKPREFILAHSEYYQEAAANGLDIRMEENDILWWMELYSAHQQEFLVKGIEWLRDQLEQYVPDTDDLQGHCESLLNSSKPLPF